jgi:3-deoxy-7-phosphoheptulonate synthase
MPLLKLFQYLEQVIHLNLIMLKRGMSAKATEWLLAADYILCGGNENVILCERGIRSFDMQSRNVFDLGVIPLMQSLSHLPVFADPSHGVGKAAFVNKMGLAAIAAGADGLMIEVHPNPEKALSDGEQALTFNEFELFIQNSKPLLSAINKSADFVNKKKTLDYQNF